MKYSANRFLDLHYPDFTARHLFSARLRIVILFVFWFIVVGVYPQLLTTKHPIVLLISLTFAVTAGCHFFILKGISPVFFFVVELMADVAAQTVLVYVAGGAKSPLVLIYIIYCASGGIFYNYRVSVVIAFLIFIFYSLLFLFTSYAWIPEFDVSFKTTSFFSGLGVWQNFVLLWVSMVVAIYGLWIASHFTKLREKVLETKNRELLALYQVSSMTRSVMTLPKVMQGLLHNAREGFGYQVTFLLYEDLSQGRIRLFVDSEAPYLKQIQRMLRIPLDQLSLSIQDEDNPVYQGMRKKKSVIRYELSEVLRGMDPLIPRSKTEWVQRSFNFKKIVSVPLVAEGRVLGALIGITRDRWVELEAIRAFEGFASQSALVLDNVMLIGELKEKNEELERVSRIKSEFLATMSHELRTPLTAIIGFSELLLEEVMGNLKSEQKESVREILVNGENLLHLINGLLDLVKIESGKMEVNQGPVTLLELLERVQRMMFSLIQKKKHRLEIKVSDSFPVIYADERKLQQVLLNLLSNAIKFTPEGGHIMIQVQSGILDSQGKKFVRFSVSDNGEGIPPEHLKSIFESFRQIDSSYTREHAGTGLGLALVKQFVELQGGHVWVTSQVGKGSVFSFTLPEILSDPDSEKS